MLEETTADKESEHSKRQDFAQRNALVQAVIGISGMVMAPTMPLIPITALFLISACRCKGLKIRERWYHCGYTHPLAYWAVSELSVSVSFEPALK